MVSFKAKDIEIYAAKYSTALTPSTRGNDKSLAKFIDEAVTAGTNVTGFAKYSSTGNEFSISPAENTTEDRKHFGSNASGAQNAETETTVENDVDVSLTIDSQVYDEITQIALAKDAITHSTYSDYASYNLGSTSTDYLLLVFRVAKLIGSTYHYRNVVLLNPVFKKAGETSASSDDTVATNEYTWTGNKSNTFIDYYTGTSAEVLVNF